MFLCSYCNYTQAILFEHITEDDINEVEAFVRDEMLSIIYESSDELDADGNSKVDKQKMIDHFGELYALKPNQFRFQPGDRKFIKLIQQSITKTIEKKGRKKAMQHFGYTYEPPKKKMLKDIESVDTDLANTMKTRLFEQILDKLKSFAVPQNFIDMFNDSFVSIDTGEGKISKGGVVCVVCYAESEQPNEIKPNHVYCRQKSGRLSWVISNFVKHFQRAHPFIKNSEIQLRRSNEQHSNIDVNENSCDNGNASTGNMSCDIMNMVFDSIIVEMDSLEKQLNEQLSKQIAKMWSIATLHGDHLECGVRCSDVDGLAISVDVVQIIGNGDCLFSSAAHQLFGKDVNSSEHKTSTNDLRNGVVKYIQEHYDDFIFDIKGHVLELQEIAANDPSCDTNGLNSIGNIDDACKYFVDKCLIQPGFWAGAESLKAIHFLHKVDIIVFNENGHITFYNNNDEQVNRVIVLAYRLSANQTTYNHYDSVCNITPDVIYNTANVISKRVNHKNDSTVVLDASH